MIRKVPYQSLGSTIPEQLKIDSQMLQLREILNFFSYNFYTEFANRTRPSFQGIGILNEERLDQLPHKTNLRTAKWIVAEDNYRRAKTTCANLVSFPNSLVKSCGVPVQRSSSGIGNKSSA